MARTVRIARSSRSDRAVTGGTFRPNTAGLTRARRLFVVYSLALGTIYGAFAAGLWFSPAGFSTNPTTAPIFLTGVAVLLGVAGFGLTLGRTPRGVEWRTDDIVLTEFLGRRRVFDRRAAREATVENRYPAGLLAPEPTEMVRLAGPGRSARRYLVGRALLPRDPDGAPGSLQ